MTVVLIDNDLLQRSAITQTVCMCSLTLSLTRWRDHVHYGRAGHDFDFALNSLR